MLTAIAGVIVVASLAVWAAPPPSGPLGVQVAGITRAALDRALNIEVARLAVAGAWS